MFTMVLAGVRRTPALQFGAHISSQSERMCIMKASQRLEKQQPSHWPPPRACGAQTHCVPSQPARQVGLDNALRNGAFSFGLTSRIYSDDIL